MILVQPSLRLPQEKDSNTFFSEGKFYESECTYVHTSVHVCVSVCVSVILTGPFFFLRVTSRYSSTRGRYSRRSL